MCSPFALGNIRIREGFAEFYPRGPVPDYTGSGAKVTAQIVPGCERIFVPDEQPKRDGVSRLEMIDSYAEFVLCALRRMEMVGFCAGFVRRALIEEECLL